MGISEIRVDFLPPLYKLLEQLLILTYLTAVCNLFTYVALGIRILVKEEC